MVVVVVVVVPVGTELDVSCVETRVVVGALVGAVVVSVGVIVDDGASVFEAGVVVTTK
jgi:hypothetical protein